MVHLAPVVCVPATPFHALGTNGSRSTPAWDLVHDDRAGTMKRQYRAFRGSKAGFEVDRPGETGRSYLSCWSVQHEL